MSAENFFWILFGVIYSSVLVVIFVKKFNELAKTEVKAQRKGQVIQMPLETFEIRRSTAR